LGGTSTTATGFTSFTSIPLVAGANSTGWGNSGIGGIHEDSQLQFRVEFHNMLNHPQFTSPGSATPVTTGYNAGTFGQIGSTSGESQADSVSTEVRVLAAMLAEQVLGPAPRAFK
jgi:hypothetical protein